MGEPAIRIEGLGKRYRVGRLRGPRTLGEDLARWARAGFGSRGRDADAPSRSREENTVWALRDVSLQVEPGQVVGVIGRNGAGKSTLLKILSRVVAPTEGWAHIRGRVGCLLEAGTGFHTELTGRENVFMSGAILGMRKAEIERKFDSIVQFAEIGPYLDTPVKRYSSGMQVRLAFAVAAHLEPEVLIVDEVLAVGDAQFQRKCLGRIDDVSRSEGRTVLFVSHNMEAVQRLCDRAILLEGGRMMAEGDTADVVARYLARSDAPASAGSRIDLSGVEREGSGRARVTWVSYWSDREDLAGRPYPDGPLTVDLGLRVDEACTLASVAVAIYDLSGARLVNADTLALGRALGFEPGRHEVRLHIPALHLNPGVYAMGFWLAGAFDHVHDYVLSGPEMEVVAYGSEGAGPRPGDDGTVTCDFELLEVR